MPQWARTAGAQKKVSDALELELEKVVRTQQSAIKQTQGLSEQEVLLTKELPLQLSLSIISKLRHEVAEEKRGR